MPRYVDADKLIAEYDRVHIGPAGGARKLIVEAPTADVQEVNHGKWEYSTKADVARCTNCNFIVQDRINNVSFMFHYCPYCGAKMDIEKE